MAHLSEWYTRSSRFLNLVRHFSHKDFCHMQIFIKLCIILRHWYVASRACLILTPVLIHMITKRAQSLAFIAINTYMGKHPVDGFDAGIMPCVVHIIRVEQTKTTNSLPSLLVAVMLEHTQA